MVRTVTRRAVVATATLSLAITLPIVLAGCGAVAEGPLAVGGLGGTTCYELQAGDLYAGSVEIEAPAKTALVLDSVSFTEKVNADAVRTYLIPMNSRPGVMFGTSYRKDKSDTEITTSGIPLTERGIALETKQRYNVVVLFHRPDPGETRLKGFEAHYSSADGAKFVGTAPDEAVHLTDGECLL